jgi:hypothetical protein
MTRYPAAVPTREAVIGQATPVVLQVISLIHHVLSKPFPALGVRGVQGQLRRHGRCRVWVRSLPTTYRATLDNEAMEAYSESPRPYPGRPAMFVPNCSTGRRRMLI